MWCSDAVQRVVQWRSAACGALVQCSGAVQWRTAACGVVQRVVQSCSAVQWCSAACGVAFCVGGAAAPTICGRFAALARLAPRSFPVCPAAWGLYVSCRCLLAFALLLSFTLQARELPSAVDCAEGEDPCAMKHCFCHLTRPVTRLSGSCRQAVRRQTLVWLPTCAAQDTPLLNPLAVLHFLPLLALVSQPVGMAHPAQTMWVTRQCCWTVAPSPPRQGPLLRRRRLFPTKITACVRVRRVHAHHRPGQWVGAHSTLSSRATLLSSALGPLLAL